MTAAGEAIAATARALAAAPIPEPRRLARQAVALVLGVDALALTMEPDRPLNTDQAKRLEAITLRLVRGEPLSRIAGRRGFWDLELAITPDVLDPRPETELLVEQALEWVRDRRDRPLRILDLGTGSGCILLSLLYELPNAYGLGVDASFEALAIARGNAQAAGLADRAGWAQGHWLSAVQGRFDLIVSNPPYIPSGVIGTLAAPVRDFDPALALDGGPDGLAAYRRLIPDLPRLLSPQGAAFLEFGAGQGSHIAQIAADNGLMWRFYHDLAGIQRCIALFTKNSACNGGNR